MSRSFVGSKKPWCLSRFSLSNRLRQRTKDCDAASAYTPSLAARPRHYLARHTAGELCRTAMIRGRSFPTSCCSRHHLGAALPIAVILGARDGSLAPVLDGRIDALAPRAPRDGGVLVGRVHERATARTAPDDRRLCAVGHRLSKPPLVPRLPSPPQRAGEPASAIAHSDTAHRRCRSSLRGRSIETRALHAVLVRTTSAEVAQSVTPHARGPALMLEGPVADVWRCPDVVGDRRCQRCNGPPSAAWPSSGPPGC